MKVILFQRILPSYRLPVYFHVNRKLNNQLIVASSFSSEHGIAKDTQNLGFELVVNHTKLLLGGKLFWVPFLKIIRHHAPVKAVIIEENFRIISTIPLLIYCKTNKIPLILWGHGGSTSRSIHSNHYRDYLNRWLIRHCDAFICYNETIRKNLSSVTAPEKLFVAKNTLDTHHLKAIRQQLDQKGKDTLKKTLNYSCTYYIAFIGRLIAGKKLDMLLKVLKMLQQDQWDVGAIIIGDGSLLNELQRQAETAQITNVHFTGEQREWEESAKYLYVADLMLIPGYVGLALNHALCFGLPVITQRTGPEGPFHSPEIEFLEEGVTGFQTENNSVNAMCEKIKYVLKNREHFHTTTISYAETHLSIENMVQGVTNAIAYAQNSK